jgi:hypothetical protein
MTRKDVVKALEDHFGVKAKYMGAPTFSYHINAEGKTFTVDREGKIDSSRWYAGGVRCFD